MTPAIRPKVRTVFFMRGSCATDDGATMRCNGADVVILSDDFAGIERKSCFRVTRQIPSRSRQQAQFFAALDRLGAAGRSQLVVRPGTMGLDGVFGNEKLVAISRLLKPRAIRVKNFELAWRDAEGLLLGRIGSEGFDGPGLPRGQAPPSPRPFREVSRPA